MKIGRDRSHVSKRSSRGRLINKVGSSLILSLLLYTWIFIFCTVMPMERLPVLEIDGKKYHQSLALCRFLAKKSNVYGSDDYEALEIDAAVDSINDFRGGEYFRGRISFSFRTRWSFIWLFLLPQNRSSGIGVRILNGPKRWNESRLNGSHFTLTSSSRRRKLTEDTSLVRRFVEWTKENSI